MGKREKAAKPAKVVTEATFDMEARRQWLTGFSKRKRERRMKGLAYGALKERQEKLATRAALRSGRPKPAPEPAAPAPAPAPRSTVEYADAGVLDQWGSAVTVTTTLGLDVDSEDEGLAAARDEPPAKREDAAQVWASSLDAMKKKVAPKMGRSAKSVNRAARKRDANPHYKGAKRGADAKSLVEKAAKKGKKSKR